MTNISEFDPVWVGLNHDFDFYVMFELSPPWHRKVELGENFPEEWNTSLANIKQRGIRVKFLAVQPESRTKPTTKIFVYNNLKSEFITLTPSVYEMPKELVSDLINDLGSASMDKYDQYKENTVYRDIFVCNHSNRDQCCGKYGETLFQAVKNEIGWSLSVRVWKSSHLGGHRMAPTFIDMPSGNLWGFVEESDLKSILNYSGNHELLMKKFRGSMGSNKLSQIAEKELFYFWGWNWFNMKRKPGVIEDLGPTKKISIEFEAYSTQQKAVVTIVEDGILFFPPNQCDDGKEIKKYYIESVDFIKS